MTPHLLVTDDDAAFRGVLCEALSRSGFEITEASDGAEAIEILTACPIHFALVDVHMPRLSGLDVMRKLIELPRRPPCALMSAAIDDEIVAQATRMQVYRVLSKPLRIKEVRDVVCGALSEIYGWKPV